MVKKIRRVGTTTALVALVALVVFVGCASEKHRALETASVESKGVPYHGPRLSLALGNVDNRSPYMRGMFSDGNDRLGQQARTVLETHLTQSGRFVVVDRDHMAETAREAGLAGQPQEITAAEVLVKGQVTEFGRRETGDRALFGILGRGKKQTAYAKVSINVVDVRTSRLVHSVQGAGEFALSNREFIGFGGTSGYDATLNGKVLNLAMLEAVNKLVADLEGGQWGPDVGDGSWEPVGAR